MHHKPMVFFINSNTWIYGTAGYQWLEAPEFKDSRQLQINHILKAKTGAIVKEVKIGSAADRSKIEVNDIIIACNGEKISNAKSLYNKLERAKMSGYVIITILRNKAEIDIELCM